MSEERAQVRGAMALRADAFLAAMAHERGCSPHTLRAYRRELEDFTAFAQRLLGEDATVGRLEHTHIRAYLGELYERGLSKASVARALAAIRSWCKWLARHGEMEQSPAALVATPKLSKHLPRVPTIEEMNRMVDARADEAAAWPARDKLILELLYGCGIRNAELVGIDLKDIQWANEVILVRGKGRKERICPLWPETVHLLRELLSRHPRPDDNPLFVNRYGQPLGASGARFKLAQYVARAAKTTPSLASKDISPHTFRAISEILKGQLAWIAQDFRCER